MNTRSLSFGTLVLACAALLVLSGADARRAARDRIQQHRNLGKAFYENPTGIAEAVEEFRQALQLAPDSVPDRLNYGLALLRSGKIPEAITELERVQKLDPKLPHTWFNLGVAYKKLGRYEKAIRQFEGFARLAPDEAVTHYNLGQLHGLTGKPELALPEFQLANRLNPRLVAPYFQIYNAYRLADDERKAAGALAAFQRAKEQQKEADETEDVEWCFYSEIYEPIEPAPAPDEPPPAVRFLDRKLAGAVDPATAGMTTLDADGDGKPDLLAWSRDGLRLFRSGSEPVQETGLESLRDVISAAVGDFDNDGLADLCILTGSGASLYRNAKGRFERVEASLPSGRFQIAVWLDYDHDYDLDLILLGAKPALLRNQGTAGFVGRTADFPFVAGEPVDAVAFHSVADDKGVDLLVSYRDHPGVLYRDHLRGTFTSGPAGNLASQARSLVALDIDNDGWMDVAFAGPKGAGVLMNRKGRLEAAPVDASGTLAAVDLENRGQVDLVAAGSVLRNEGAGRLAAGKNVAGLPKGLAWAVADFNGDGRVDLAAVAPDGSLHLLVNRTTTRNQWIRVGLEGVKNLRLSPGSEVEVKAGASYQKRLYQGEPLLFGLGPYTQVDTVRITWPNGMVQNEVRQPAGRPFTCKEAPRLSGSCPMIFAWNGREFQFVTDVLGVAPLGASSGDGAYFPVDHDEYVRIPASALAPVDGRYEIRITEELREVSYLDKVQLIAADHLAGTEIFTNEKFKSPPFPEFRLFGVRRRFHPVRAIDQDGHDVLARLLRVDRTYPDDFRRNQAGVARWHTLDLDFGPAAARDGRALLVLNGWVDWADGSTFLGASQEAGGGIVLPYLQVKDAQGAWRTVIGDMGMPAGKPKTMVVDLTGKFLSASRQVRIVTSACLYWDEIFLSEDTGTPPVRLSPLSAFSADLHFRGFSRPVIHPERKQPEAFDYAHASAISMWNPTRGLYTRYGDVRELVESVDDRLVIMGSGDELRLRFDARALPPLAPGWARDFLLLVDGWAKDGDANTAFSQNVEPLPFHRMSGYPYPAGERFPADALHASYRTSYNTRPALRLLRPLR